MDNTPRQPIPLYVKAVAALMTLVVSGLGLLAFFFSLRTTALDPVWIYGGA